MSARRIPPTTYIMSLNKQAVLDYKPAEIGADEQTASTQVLVRWLQKLQFKMGQIEMQASNVTQFFTV